MSYNDREVFVYFVFWGGWLFCFFLAVQKKKKKHLLSQSVNNTVSIDLVTFSSPSVIVVHARGSKLGPRHENSQASVCVC